MLYFDNNRTGGNDSKEHDLPSLKFWAFYQAEQCTRTVQNSERGGLYKVHRDVRTSYSMYQTCVCLGVCTRDVVPQEICLGTKTSPKT
jgi:hypothetical protein